MVIGVGRPIMNDLPFMHMSLAEVSRVTIDIAPYRLLNESLEG
jgi:hypothetical protein